MNKKKIAILIIELVIVIWTVCSVVSMATGSSSAALADKHNCFRYFTVDSNILSAIASMVCVVTLLMGRSSHAASVFKFVGTVSVTVTFLTVAFFLGPVFGYAQMLAGCNLYLHLIGPVLAIITCCLGADEKPLTVKESLFGLLSVVLYGIVYMTEVVIVKNWEDFYGFQKFIPWWVSFILMLAATYAIVVGLRLLRNKAVKAKA